MNDSTLVIPVPVAQTKVSAKFSIIPAPEGAFGLMALAYWREGANVLPIRPGTKRPPKGLRYRKWHTQRQTETEARDLIRRFFFCDIALILGPVSGGLIDVEYDSQKGEQALATLEAKLGSLPETEAWTSQHEHPLGLHRLYKTGLTFGRRVLAPGLEARGRGCYSIVPPNAYRHWVKGGQLSSLSPLPAEWMGFLQRRERILDTRINLNNSIVKDITYTSIEDTGSALPDHPNPLKDLYADQAVIIRLLAFLGVEDPGEAVAGKAFRCPLHPEQHPSATAIRGKSGRFVFHDWHSQGEEGEFFTLPEVYFAILTKRKHLESLPKPTHAVWGIRLLAEAGIISLPELKKPKPLPQEKAEIRQDVSETVRKVYQGFQLLLRCKQWYDSTADLKTAFSYRFAADWCGINPNSLRSISQAIYWLCMMGFLDMVHKGKSAKDPTLYSVPYNLFDVVPYSMEDTKMIPGMREEPEDEDRVVEMLLAPKYPPLRECPALRECPESYIVEIDPCPDPMEEILNGDERNIDCDSLILLDASIGEPMEIPADARPDTTSLFTTSPSLTFDVEADGPREKDAIDAIGEWEEMHPDIEIVVV